MTATDAVTHGNGRVVVNVRTTDESVRGLVIRSEMYRLTPNECNGKVADVCGSENSDLAPRRTLLCASFAFLSIDSMWRYSSPVFNRSIHPVTVRVVGYRDYTPRCKLTVLVSRV